MLLNKRVMDVKMTRWTKKMLAIELSKLHSFEKVDVRQGKDLVFLPGSIPTKHFHLYNIPYHQDPDGAVFQETFE